MWAVCDKLETRIYTLPTVWDNRGYFIVEGCVKCAKSLIINILFESSELDCFVIGVILKEPMS